MPEISTNLVTAITEPQVIDDFGVWKYDDDNKIFQIESGDKNFTYGATFLGSTGSDTWDAGGGIKYHKGALFSVEGSIVKQYNYYIRKSTLINTTLGYEIDVTTPSDYQDDGSGVIPHANEAMMWVTGVSSDQTFDTVVTYYQLSNPNVPLTATSTTSVGTTPSNIKLNWVANDIKTQLDADVFLEASVYDNAVYINTVAGYAITKVETTNNYDVSSIHGVTEATKDNKIGIQDISNLPPLFLDGFILRVSPTAEDKSNYYMKYDAEFKGWKETALDESRFLDRNSLPYIIDKSKVRESGQVTIEPETWEGPKAGDTESNKEPSFVGRTINDIFFYGSRLGFATDDTLVLSAIDKQTTFFKTTATQTKKSDRVDIKLDSSKIGYDPIKHVITYDGKLFINTGSNQSVLLVNTSFDLTSARLTEVSSYSLGDNRPMNVDGGLYFANTTKDITNVYNYVPIGNGIYEAIEMTKHCPRYLKGAFKHMAYSSDLAVVSTFDDPKTLYVQNRYSQGGQVLQNAWHKWTLPYDVNHFYFHDNVLYIIMTGLDSVGANKHAIVTQYDIKPQDVSDVANEIYIGWTPILDCYTKDKALIEDFAEFTGVNDLSGVSFDTVTEAYDSTEVTQDTLGAVDGPYLDKNSPIFYWKIEVDTNTIIWNDGTPIVFGNNNLLSFDSGGFRYTRSLTDDGTGHYEVSRAAITTTVYYNDEMLYGIPFTSKVILSEVVPRQASQEGFVIQNYSTLMLRRMRLLLDKSGLFNVTVDFKNRKDYVIKYTGLPLGEFVVGRGTVSDINFNFPINGKSDRVEIIIETVDSTPFNLLSTEWQGQLINKGRNI